MTKKGFLYLTPSPSTDFKIYQAVKGNNQLGELWSLTNSDSKGRFEGSDRMRRNSTHPWYESFINLIILAL